MGRLVRQGRAFNCVNVLFTLAFGCWLLAFGRLKDGKLNSRGFSYPWNTSRFNYRTVCKDGGFQYRGTFKSSASLPFRVFTDAISILPLASTDLKVRGYSPFGHPVFQTFSLCNVMLNLFQHLSAEKNE